MSDLREMFFEECDDLLESLTVGLTALEDGSGDDETINAMFRAVHSIKGGAGAFGLDRLIAFAHTFENVMDDLRMGRLTADGAVTSLLLTASDHLNDLVSAARDEDELPETAGADVLASLSALSPDDSATPEPEAQADALGFVPIALDLNATGPALADIGPEDDAAFVITFKPDQKLYDHGHDPTLFFRTLRRMGDLHVTADCAGVQPLGTSPGSPAGLSWTLLLRADDGIDENAIREVFEFAEGLCQLEVTAQCSEPAMGETGAGGTGSAAVETSATATADMAKPDRGTREDAAKSANRKAPGGGRGATIRVDLTRVDRLINLVGELVISEAMLRQSIDELPRSASTSLTDAMGQLRQLSGVIQESVMAIRAQPVRGLFQRMSRTMRDSARQSEKSARLIMIGEGTEVDKTVTERLVDPLTHMIRNSVDHGLETPAERVAAGKPEQGVITLEAAHRSGRVVISLSDDGAGIDRVRVRAIAEQKGLIQPDEDLSDGEIDMLLFRPGFSTAETVSSLSGRGVGMDVVRSEIQALGGRITLHSEQGKGTKVSISLPLTLAVMEGMLVRVGDEALVVPTLALRETMQPEPEDVHAFCENDRALSINGELIPVIDLGAALGFRPASHDITGQPVLLLEAESGLRTALAVDSIVDQREVVIKGLEQNYHQIPGIAAATILGDGKIALIVDTDQMIQSQRQTIAFEPPSAASPGVKHHV